jgi:hypothetical protein
VALTGVSGAATAKAKDDSPLNTSPPSVNGQAQQGQTLNTTTGSWDNGVNSYAYQWQRCDKDGNNCADISGAASSSYVMTSTDVGHRLRVVVSATNDVGTNSAASGPSDVVTTASTGPTTVSPPTISGQAQEGQTLFASTGNWDGGVNSYAYQWQRCDSNSNNCTDIPGATSSSYLMTSTDVGHRLLVVVRATNNDGTNAASSHTTDVVATDGPTNTSRPSISGTAAQGATLTASPGAWSGNGSISFAYQWLRCDSNGNNCSNLSGATAQTYVPVAADLGHRLAVVVTAKDSRGASSATSGVTAVVSAQQAPANVSLPTIGGVAQQGKTLAAGLGTWNGTSVAFTYQWQRCDANGNGCANIPGATKTTYVTTSADVGHRLRLFVTGKNAVGSASARSNPSGVVAPTGATAGTSIPVTSVASPNRLVLSRVDFTPNRIHSRTAPLVVRFRVADAHGNAVRDALVYAIGVPSNRASFRGETRTDQNGWATFTYQILRGQPIKQGARLTFFVRARKPGDSVLAGVSTRRLVSVGVSPG